MPQCLRVFFAGGGSRGAGNWSPVVFVWSCRGLETRTYEEKHNDILPPSLLLFSRIVLAPNLSVGAGIGAPVFGLTHVPKPCAALITGVEQRASKAGKTSRLFFIFLLYFGELFYRCALHFRFFPIYGGEGRAHPRRDLCLRASTWVGGFEHTKTRPHTPRQP